MPVIKIKKPQVSPLSFQKELSLLIEKNEEWTRRALRKINTCIAPGTEIMGEDIHDLIEEQPHSSGAWGALVALAVKHDLIRKTGEWRQSSREKNHAHEYAVYVRSPWVYKYGMYEE